MAFWGVYVKPEEPYILKPDSDGRRLRIAQATLGEQCEVEMARILLQCAVGNNPPISVCSLSMKELSCCPLNLEFEECEDVVCSVVGPCGVYLAGYYLAQCASCTTSRDGASGFIIRYYDGKTSEEAENLKDKKLTTTEEAGNETGKTFTTKEAANVEDKKLSTTEEAENEKDKNITTIEAAKKEKDKMLSAVEEDIEDIDSFVDGKLYDSEENTYDLSDSFIDDCDLSAELSMQELLGVEVNGMMENEEPKNKISSSKRLKRNQSTESDGGIGSKQKQQTTNNSSPGIDGGAYYKRGSGGNKSSKQKQRTVKNLSSGVGGADFKRGSGGTLGRRQKGKFNHLTISGEPESGGDANSDMKTHDQWEDMNPQRKKRKKKENFSGGIVVHELAKGKPNGKIATQGKKVKIMYTAWIKETGKVLESNSGQAPFKFQLGDEEIIKGWNVGVEGMRVGDKRRLIIPPSMGSWRIDENMIPTNSFLVYDIELVGVR